MSWKCETGVCLALMRSDADGLSLVCSNRLLECFATVARDDLGLVSLAKAVEEEVAQRRTIICAWSLASCCAFTV